MNTILSRLKEASTYRGLAVLAGAAGVAISPSLTVAIGTAVAAVLGLIEVIRSERNSK